MKLLVILIVTVGMAAGALHHYQQRNLLIQAALLSEGFTLSESVRARVAEHYVEQGVMPHDNADADLPPGKSIYGTSVKRVTVNLSGTVLVDFADEVGEQSLIFTPSVSPVSGLVDWRCTSDSIDRKTLELLRPTCQHIASTNEGMLINAIANAKVDEVKHQLAQGANPNAVVYGNTPLMLAAKIGNLEIVKLLSDEGASVDNNALNAERRTPLMVAISSNHADVVAYLLSKGASVTRRGYKGLTAQDHAVNTDRRLGGERYELMVLARLNPNFAGAPKRRSKAPRSSAAQAAHLESLHGQFVLAATDCHVQRLATLLREENDFNSPEMVDGEPLLSHIRKPVCSEKLQSFIKTKSIYKKALHAKFSAANRACDMKIVDSLLRANADIDIVAREDRYSHFDRAVIAGCADLAAYYIRNHELGDKLDGEHLSNAIQKAPTEKQVEMVGTLIAAGINVNYRDESGETLLAAAISLEQPVVAKFLVDAGADVNASTKNGSYPLIEASKKGFNHLVAQLVREGAQINQRDAMGRTALISAVAKGRKRLVDTLLRSGANPLHRDNDGISAVALAESRNFDQIYTQLTASASSDIN